MRLIARFAQEQENCFEIITVYDEKRTKEQIDKKKLELLSISNEYPSAVWFEQKISDDFGIKILQTKNTSTFVKHEHFPKEVFPMRKNFSKIHLEHRREKKEPIEEKNNITLGLTHSFSLESSLFNIIDDGHNIVNFKLIPFYKYRGIEKMVEGLTLEESRAIIERISAPLTIAYQNAWLDIYLQASRKILPDAIKKRHIFLLELERISNHLQDLALLCTVVGFEEGASFFSKFVEGTRMVMKNLTGHRFGFNSIVLEERFLEIEDTYVFLLNLEKELLIFERWIEKNEKHLAKMIFIGGISKELIEAYGLVGIMARSVGLKLDRRENDGFYDKHNFYMNQEERGDVFSRFNIRMNEILTSLRVMRNLVKNNNIQFFKGTVKDGEYYSFVESSAGELMMYISLQNGVINRFYVRDPSFLNAQALPLMLKDIKIANLGLMLKSIPLNISAIDL